MEKELNTEYFMELHEYISIRAFMKGSLKDESFTKDCKKVFGEWTLGMVKLPEFLKEIQAMGYLPHKAEESFEDNSTELED